MRKLFLLAIAAFAFATNGHAQANADDVLKKLMEMPDQFDKTFDTKDLGDEMVLIFVPGSDNPFQKFYTKKKGAKMVPNALIVGGFKEMMGGMSMVSKKKHLQEALAMRYKQGSSTLLLDLDSKLADLLSLQGYSIIRISKKENKVLEINDFGFDRVEFFNALKQYELEEEKEGTDD